MDIIGLNGVYLPIHNLTFILTQNPLYYIKKSIEIFNEKIYFLNSASHPNIDKDFIVEII